MTGVYLPELRASALSKAMQLPNNPVVEASGKVATSVVRSPAADCSQLIADPLARGHRAF